MRTLKTQKHEFDFFASLKKLKEHEFSFLQAQKSSSFFASLKKLKKHGFHFLQASKSSKNMHLIFYKLKKAQNT